ncbi:MAG: hypothetical protein LBF50_08895 [Azoarcus sp.]|jgi:hypothetical protein|nr:hypothetical protein [Azoarcus sp.]
MPVIHRPLVQSLGGQRQLPSGDLLDIGAAEIAGPFPDYANAETLTGISAGGAAWVADRSGFIAVQVTINPNPYNAFDVVVDGVTIFRHSDYYPNGNGWSYAWLFPVAAGQAVSVQVDGAITAFSAQFIPPLLATISAPNIISCGSYSLLEQATDENWIDSKPIYRRTISLPDETMDIGSSGRINYTNIFGAANYVDKLIRLDCRMTDGVGNEWVGALPLAVNNATNVAIIYNKRTDILSLIWATAGLAGAMKDAYITFHYTKS